MKRTKILLNIIVTMFLVSCATAMQSMYPEPEPEKLFAIYPKYRIDNKLQKVCIIGDGPNKSEISLALTGLIKDESNIKIVESGNLQQLLGGKIIEYGTGLTTSESQAIAQMLQVDHLILFEEKIAPYRDYIYGGRVYNQINIKIVNTLSGEIIFQASNSFWFIRKDPRSYGYSHLNELSTSDTKLIMNINLTNIIFQLRYALGKTKIGITPDAKSNQLQVLDKMVDSPADRAGIQKGDKIIGINDVKINNNLEYGKYLEELKPKQGDILRFKIERGGKILELEVKLPVVPFSQEELKEKPEKDTSIKL